MPTRKPTKIKRKSTQAVKHKKSMERKNKKLPRPIQDFIKKHPRPRLASPKPTVSAKHLGLGTVRRGRDRLYWKVVRRGKTKVWREVM